MIGLQLFARAMSDAFSARFWPAPTYGKVWFNPRERALIWDTSRGGYKIEILFEPGQIKNPRRWRRP